MWPPRGLSDSVGGGIAKERCLLCSEVFVADCFDKTFGFFLGLIFVACNRLASNIDWL